MFPKLHRQMASFCTLITGIIFASLSFACLFFAENSIRQNNYASFLKELSTLLANLQQEDIISHQWLNQMQENHHLTIFLYDNGNPLYYQHLQNFSQSANTSSLSGDSSADTSSTEDSPADTPSTGDSSADTPSTGDSPAADLSALALEAARQNLGLDILKTPASLTPQHEEFSFRAQNQDYYASAGVLSKGSGRLSFVILYSLKDQNRQLSLLRAVILSANGAALLLLFFFSWLFTGHLLKPLEESRLQQSQFIASASHELRSPLAVMLSGLESMEKADTPEESKHFARLIRSEGQRMQHLISDMLLLAGSDSHNLRLRPAWLQPDELLLEVYEAHEALARKKQLSLRLWLPKEPLPDCFWDGERIRQLLTILLDNALSYTPAGKCIFLFLSAEGNQMLLGVADQGPGISDKEKALIFQRFYRAQSSRTDKEHFGLGLCVAKEIVQAHQGQIRVLDKQAGGSVFLAKLPAKASDSGE